MDCSMPGFPVLHYLPVCSNSCPLSQWCRPTISSSVNLLPPSPPASIFPSIKVFSNELALSIRWLKYWSFSFSISPSSEYSELISFRIDWFDLPAVQRTLKSLLQHHNLKAPNHGHSVFFMVQLSDPHDYWKNHSLDYTDPCWQSYVSLLIKMLPRFVIAFLPRSSCSHHPQWFWTPRK